MTIFKTLEADLGVKECPEAKNNFFQGFSKFNELFRKDPLVTPAPPENGQNGQNKPKNRVFFTKNAKIALCSTAIYSTTRIYTGNLIRDLES